MISIKNLLHVLVVTSAMLMSVNAYANWWPFSSDDNTGESQGSLSEIIWEDLIPDDFVPPENPLYSMTREEVEKLMDGSPESNKELARLRKEFYYAPVVDSLDGKRIKMAGYVTPLEFDGQTEMSEFLLVPYVGACMHTPPPPANQIVHTVSPKTVKIPNIYDPVWVVGTIRTETVTSDLAESGYRLDLEKIMPYTQ